MREIRPPIEPMIFTCLIASTKTSNLTEPLYTQEEFEYIEPKKVTALVSVYNKFHEKFSEKNIQNLAIQDFYKIILFFL